jgi:hypothetical protein
MKLFILALLICCSCIEAPAQVRSVVHQSVDFSTSTSSDTTRNSWPTLLTVTWTGSLADDTLMVKYIPTGGGSATLAFYDPAGDAVDTLLVRSAPVQSVYLWSRKYHRVYLQRPGGILKSGSAATITFE